MAKIRDILTILLFCAAIAPLSAKGGATGNDFLISFTDARPAALSGAFVATASGISSIFINPAGIAASKISELSIIHNIDLFDRATEHLSFSIPFQDFSLGLSATYGYTSNFVEIDEYGDRQGMVSNYDYIVCVSISEQFMGWFAGGINFKYFGSYLYKHSKNGLAVDFGALLWYDIFKFGVSIQNLGTQSAFINTVDALPVIIRTGIGIKTMLNKTDYFSAEAGAVIPAEVTDEKSFNAGAEWFALGMFALRAGVNLYEESGLFISLGASLNTENFNFEYTLGSVNNSNKSHRMGITCIF